MKILKIKGYGDIKSNLTFSEIVKPTILDNQVLIEVYAASINPIDYKIVEGALQSIKWHKVFNGSWKSKTNYR